MLLDNFKDKNVLITGGLGFIGSNLAIKLIELGAKVTLLDSMYPDYGGNLFNIEPIKDKVFVNFSDMRDTYSLSYLVKEKDYIFNIAGQVSHIDSMKDPLTDMEINVRAQLFLLEICRKYNKEAVIVYSSTRQFYGRPQYLPVDEKHPVIPTDVNGINKLAGEQYHLLYHKVHGLKTTALRLTNTYGPRQLIRHNRQGFIGWFIRKIVLDEEIEIFGDGHQIRDFNHVEDVVNALLLAAVTKDCYGEYFNLGGEHLTLLELVKLMIEIHGKGSYRLVPFPEEKKRIDIGDFYGEFTKFKTTTGWEPRVSLKDGLRSTFSYYERYKDHYL